MSAGRPGGPNGRGSIPPGKGPQLEDAESAGYTRLVCVSQHDQPPCSSRLGGVQDPSERGRGGGEEREEGWGVKG